MTESTNAEDIHKEEGVVKCLGCGKWFDPDKEKGVGRSWCHTCVWTCMGLFKDDEDE